MDVRRPHYFQNMAKPMIADPIYANGQSLNTFGGMPHRQQIDHATLLTGEAHEKPRHHNDRKIKNH
jgi:hypothetical protein